MSRKILTRLSAFWAPLDFSSPWKHQADLFRSYWRIYGGKKAIVTSPYAQIGFVVTVIYGLSGKACRASELALSILPSLLGFTIGGMAIVLAVSSTDIFRRLAQDGKPDSFFMGMVSNYLHYVIVQAVAIVLASIFAGSAVVGFVIAALVFYSIATTISIAVQLFQMARIYNAAASLPKPKRKRLGRGR